MGGPADCEADGARRIGLRRVLAWGAVGLACVAAAAVAVHVHGDRRWREFQRRADALERRIAVVVDRPVLHGEPRDEDAWPHYAEALRAVVALCPDPNEANRVLGTQTRARPEQEARRSELLGRSGRVLTPLRRGAQAVRCRVPFDPARGLGHPTQNLLEVVAVVHFAAAVARQAAANGEHEEATHVALDALQLGRDLWHSPVAIDCSIGWQTLDAVERLMSAELAPALDPAARDRLATAVQRCVGGFAPWPPYVVGEAALFRHWFEWLEGAYRPSEWNVGWPWPFWRWGFSPRLCAASCGHELADIVDRLDASAPEQVVPYLRRLDAGLPVNHNPLTRGVAPAFHAARYLDGPAALRGLHEALRAQPAPR